MRVDENRIRELHFIQALVIRDVLRRGLGVTRHVDEHVWRAEVDEMRPQPSDETLDDVRQDARHAQRELEVSESVDEISGAARDA